MELYDNLRNQAKLDSRRFGKGVVCRILVPPLLDIAEQEGLIPKGVFINPETGLDPINNKMLVVPTVKYPEIMSYVKNYQTKLDKQDVTDTNFEEIESVTESKSSLVRLLQQNMILVTASLNKPQGFEAGLLPDSFDVIIDSVDVNQTIEAVYVYRTKENIRVERKINE